MLSASLERVFGFLVFFAFLSFAVSAEMSGRVLVVGYGPFLNYTTNPSMKVANTLNGQVINGLSYEGHVVSVDVSGASWLGNRLESDFKKDPELLPDVVIMMGLYDGITSLHFELCGKNVLSSNSSKEIVPGGPGILATTANPGIIDTLAFSGWLEFSNDAGTYYCNEESYRTFYKIRMGEIISPRTGKLLQAVFIHLPNESDSSIDNDVSIVTKIVETLFVNT